MIRSKLQARVRLTGLAQAAAGGTALAFVMCLSTAQFASAQSHPPVPTAPPQDAPRGETADAPKSEAGAAPEAGAPPADIPLPQARPDPTPGEVTAAPTPPTAEAPKPEPKPEAAEPAATQDKPEAPPAASPPTPPAPQPAYVPPEKARTEPEPGAPETPDMAVTPAETVEAAAAVEDAVACEKELKARGATFTVGETIAEGQCGVLRPVSVTKLSSGVKVSPGTVFLCRTALALDIWVSDGVEPAAKEEFSGKTVKALSQASTYSCRDRASETRISEHSRGSAIDIAGFELSDGRSVPVDATTPGTPEDRFAARVRRAACGPFRTVLGPGTDSDHGTHLHLDIAARSNDATYCR